MKRPCNRLLLCVLLVLILVQTGGIHRTSSTRAMILATTTSTEQTGLLDAILPSFTEKTGIHVKVVAVGSGQALQMGRTGEADVLLVHAKADEEKFVSDGYGLERFDVMYNDFVLLGFEPPLLEDTENIIQALQSIADRQLLFISRGDDSGTHKMELKLWEESERVPQGSWYLSAGRGMGDVIQMANEKRAYTLSDRGTYLSMKDKCELQVLVENSDMLRNPYGVIAVNFQESQQQKTADAKAFIQWLLSKETQAAIGQFGVDQYGEALFIPNAKE